MPHPLIRNIIENRHFVAVPAATSVREAARLMREHEVGAVVVVDSSGGVTGVCAERDVVIGVVAARRDPEATTVGAVMTPNPQTVAPEAPFGQALHIMHLGAFRHLPVVDAAGRPLGLLCARDALCMSALEFGAEAILPDEIADML